MNISKVEQRVLHVLAQGGTIRFDRAPNGKVTAVTCLTRDGAALSDCTLELFQRLRKRCLIHSSDGRPYHISRLGLRSVRAQLDNR
ncbi:MAG: YjhX family toxin [Pseudomonadota bacterium]